MNQKKHTIILLVLALFTITGCNQQKIIEENTKVTETFSFFENSSVSSGVAETTTAIIEQEKADTKHINSENEDTTKHIVAQSTTENVTEATSTEAVYNVPPDCVELIGWDEIQGFLNGGGDPEKYLPYTWDEIIAACENVYLPTISGDGSDISNIIIYFANGDLTATIVSASGCIYGFTYPIPIGTRLYEIGLNKDCDDASELLHTNANGAQIDIVWRTAYGRYCGNVTYNDTSFNFHCSNKDNIEQVKNEMEQFKYIKFSDLLIN